MSPANWEAIWLTAKLATITTVILLVMGIPIAWWLATTRFRFRTLVESFIALPLVLPPTVLGFYLLLLLGASGPIAQLTGGTVLAFSFIGLVVGSLLYSMPFVIQPLYNSFCAVDPKTLEAAATLGASAWDRFWSIVIPQSKIAIVTAATLGFAHTVGEFGVVLMIGGNIAGKTKVLSIAIYDHVEALEYGQTHLLAGSLLAFSFILLFVVYSLNRRFRLGAL